jgi:hypothetical protein
MGDGIKRLAQFWNSLAPSAVTDRRATAEDLERRYDIRLPTDFKAYLTMRVPGKEFMDDGGIIWWPIGRIKSLREECGEATPDEQRNPAIEAEADRYLVFSDYLDWCYAYAICCSESINRGKVALIGSSPDRFVARSFSSFVRLAAEDSDRLHSPAGDWFTDLV